MNARTANAEAVALRARVFVRRARSRGHSNLIDEMCLQESATALGISGSAYSLRTAKRIVLREARAMDEMHLVGFGRARP